MFSSGLQFGFKRGVSTSMCTQFLNNHGGSPVYYCLLDVSKAFDLVDNEILFSKLVAPCNPSLSDSLV